MDYLRRMFQRLLFMILAVSAAIPATTAAAAAISKPSCDNHCGNVSIPFPFGLNNGCYLNERYQINCNASNFAFLGNTGIQVLNISLEGQLRISASAAYDCYNEVGNTTLYSSFSLDDTMFPLSYTQNKFIAIGCDTYALVGGTRGHNYTTGCISYCDQITDIVNGSCGGIGCCQTFIPKGVHDFDVQMNSYFKHKYVWNYNPCSYAFVIEESSYRFSSLDLANLASVHVFPVVLDWAIGNKTCEDARKKPETYACKENSICYEPDNGPGYRCNCSVGYQGNPYLTSGCQDIDECRSPDLNLCTHKCDNTAGNYTCSCPKRHKGDGRKDGTGCTPIESSNILSIIGVSTSIALLFMIIALIVMGIQKKKSVNLRKECFKHNGGLLLRQLLFKSKNSVDAAKIFVEDELKKATEKFSSNMVIGQGGYGVVYKGVLTDNRIVAIKKSKAIDRTQIEQFINEVIVISQIYHPNVVKLLGCCLETPVPLLVYEYITNGTLFYHLHNEARKQILPWETRLQIAEETARALACMHSMQIIHRDVKSANILLDDEYTAKVSDFGVSRLIPFDEDQIPTLVQGTLGYMDPEYFQSGILTEKSDVYSFGVVLAELLTGKKAICSDCEERSLALYFISALKLDNLSEILEDRVKEEGNPEQLKQVAELARSCLRLEADKRPTMKQVMKEIEILRQSGDNQKLKPQISFEEKYSTRNSESENSDFSGFCFL